MPLSNWWTCDGAGERPRIRATQNAAFGAELPGVTRRGLLVGAGIGLVSWLGTKSALADVTVRSDRRDHDILVTIFMRGGADGLNLVVPYAEEAYYRARPNLALARPKDKRTPERTQVLDLDGFFGLHPSLAPLLPLYQSGQLAALHAVGSDDRSRSHFEAMSTVERGASHDKGGPSSGWLARHLLSTQSTDDSPLRAVAFGDTMPDSLRGATQALSLNSLADFRLAGEGKFEQDLAQIYGLGRDEVQHAGRQTLGALDSLNRLDPKQYKPANGAIYPEGSLGQGLREVACLIRGKVGLEAACLDKGGWDTHVAQGSDIGWQATLMDDLAKSVAAFVKDLGPEMKRVTVLVMSEFGRRVEENAGLGTDHGRGGAMFVVGGSVRGGKVYAKWPGINPDQLDTIGDLKVTTDYRSVLGEILTKRMGNRQLAAAFPEFGGEFLGLLA